MGSPLATSMVTLGGGGFVAPAPAGMVGHVVNLLFINQRMNVESNVINVMMFARPSRPTVRCALGGYPQSEFMASMRAHITWDPAKLYTSKSGSEMRLQNSLREEDNTSHSRICRLGEFIITSCPDRARGSGLITFGKHLFRNPDSPRPNSSD